jgi:hypothetical protein
VDKGGVSNMGGGIDIVFKSEDFISKRATCGQAGRQMVPAFCYTQKKDATSCDLPVWLAEAVEHGPTARRAAALWGNWYSGVF